MHTPKITVLMPVYNGEKYLHESIESILNQSYVDFEFLIIDDASVDKSAEIVRLFDDPRICYLKNDRNLGLIGTLNKGLDIARGEYIARMDQDDISLPKRFAKQVAFLDRHPEIGVLGTAIQMIDSDGNSLESALVFPDSPICIEWAMYFFCPIAHPTVFMRKNIAKEGGGYSPEAVHAEDYDFWVRLSKITRFSNLVETLLKLRKHETNMTKVFYSENLTTADRTAQMLAADHLGKFYAGGNLFGDRRGTVENPLLNATMIFNLCSKMMERRAPSPAEKKFIRQDAGRRLFGILLNNQISVKDRLKILWFILLINPFGAVQYSFRWLRRRVTWM
jgi:glycosyltransferase involved in cell wall biosynthesis